MSNRTNYVNDVRKVYKNPSNHEMRQGERIACFAARRVGWAVTSAYRKEHGGQLPKWLQDVLVKEAPEIANQFVDLEV